ncbi:hypothetical protein [Nitrosospira multiformis]|nr:hypothetical protein [Nitrosospira multiformis]
MSDVTGSHWLRFQQRRPGYDLFGCLAIIPILTVQLRRIYSQVLWEEELADKAG